MSALLLQVEALATQKYAENRKKISSSSSLHKYAMIGDSFNVKFELLNHSSSSSRRFVDSMDKITGRTALMEAVANGHLHIVKLLCTDFHADVNKVSLLGKTTSLHIAVELGFRDIATFLILNNADINIKDKRGCRPIHLVHSINMAKLLQKFGADPCIRTLSGLRPSEYYEAKCIDNEVNTNNGGNNNGGGSGVKKTLLNFLQEWEFQTDLDKCAAANAS